VLRDSFESSLKRSGDLERVTLVLRDTNVCVVIEKHPIVTVDRVGDKAENAQRLGR
jgi:hypothetical protein